MRKKLPCLLLSGALALSLAACAPGAEEPSPSLSPSAPPPEPSVQALATPTPEPRPSPEPSVQSDIMSDLDLPDRDYQPWQVGYMDFLARLCQTDNESLWEQEAYKGLAVDNRGVYVQDFGAKQPLTGIMSMGSESYSLYDVDRDGVPELFVEYGQSYITQCYTWRDGQVVCVGEFYAKDSSLYTHPEKNVILRAGGRMGYYELYEYPMEGGVLTEEREIFSEGPVDFPTNVGEIVPGAQPIDRFWIWLGEYEYRTAPDFEGMDDGRPHPSAGKALLLPICDCGVGPAATGNSSETARTAILAALHGETQLYGASGDHFDGDTGPTTWAEYVQPKAASPSNGEPLEIKAHAWQDMNGDGQEECLLRLWWPGLGDGWDTVVLSQQDGTVYAYFFGISGKSEVFTDGAALDYFDGTVRLSFWKDQCYQYSVPDTAAPAVKWLDGPPQE